METASHFQPQTITIIVINLESYNILSELFFKLSSSLNPNNKNQPLFQVKIV